MAKVRKTKMTVDRLARMTQREFVLARQEMQEGFTDLNGKVDTLPRDTVAGFQEVGSGMKAIIHELKEVRSEIVEPHDLRARVERLEKKVGLRG
jgi:hypothetical protein